MAAWNGDCTGKRHRNDGVLYSYDQRVAQKVWTFRTYLRLKHFTAIFAIKNAFDYAYTQLERNLGEPRNISMTFMYDL